MEISSYPLTKDIVKLLLKDNTTKQNLLFATDSYASFGFKETDEIPLNAVYNKDSEIPPLIKFRFEKDKETTKKRVKQKGEVFTPAWVCNAQNNLVDDVYLGKKEQFNREIEENHTWIINKKKVKFPKGKTWQDYVLSNRLEITCGEAPYLVSRYDAPTGTPIDVENRIGLLDRKLRVVSENTKSKDDWFFWTDKAYKSIYGYEYQGDNVFLARKNLLFTFFDYYEHKFKEDFSLISNDIVKSIARIIVWNIFQMDGLKCVIPLSCEKNAKLKQEPSLFDDAEFKQVVVCEGCKDREYIKNIRKHIGTYVKIKDWEKNKIIHFVDLIHDDDEEVKNGK